MVASSFLLAEEDTRDKHELKQDIDDLEFQVFRMQQNLKEIAKKSQVLGIEQTKDDRWVIVYTVDDGHTFQIMLTDCDRAYDGSWDFCIQAQYANQNRIHIGDIKGPENKGYGSICIEFLKDVANEQNIQYVTGDIAERDWDHLDRLIHFYRKHNFDVKLEDAKKAGEIIWNPAYQN